MAKIKDIEKIKRKIWEKYSQAMKRIPSKELEIYHNSSTPTDERQKIHDKYMAETSISLIDDIVATLDEESSLAYKNGDAEKKAFIVSSQLASILESQTRENLFLVTLTGYNEKDIEKIFTAQNAKLKFLKDFDTNAVNTDLVNIFDIQQKLQNSDDFIELNTKLPQGEKLFCIVRGPTDKTITIGNKYSNNNKSIDFSNFIIVGDFNSGKQDVQDAIKLLPYAVIGKLIISSWDKEVFSKINVLPYAEIIDCSFSINDLNDLSGKLPNGIQTLIVQETLIKPNSLKDTNKLESAKNFRKQYPNIIVTDVKGKYILPLDLDAPKPAKTPEVRPSPRKISEPVIEKEEPNTDGLLSMTQAYEQFIANTNISKTDFTRKDFINFIKLTFREKIVPLTINGQPQNYIRDLDYNDIEHATMEYIKQRQDKSQQQDVPVVEKQVVPENQEVVDTTNKDHFVSKTNCQIRKYISKKDLEVFSNSVDEQNNLLRCLELFNMWDQRNNINNGTCKYLENGNERPLSGMICRNINTFSYRSDAGGVVDFKSTTLKDSNGNTVKDANGNEIYILVSIGAVPSHERGSRNRFAHNKTIRTNDVYVTQNKLTSQQKDRINHNKQGKNITFLSLPELDLAQKYTSFIYDPMDKSVHRENDTAYQEKPSEPIKTTEVTKTSIQELPPEDTFQQPKEFTTPQQQPVDIPKSVVEQAPEEETWTIAELAKFLGVSDEDVREANKSLPETNKEWFIGHARGRRFLVKHRDAYKMWFNTARTKPEPVAEKPVMAPVETPIKRKSLADFKGITVFADNWMEILKQYEVELNEYNARVTDAEDEVHKINDQVKAVEQKAASAQTKITQISEQITKRLAAGSFDFEGLRTQGNIEKRKKEAAEQELEATKKRAVLAKQKLEQAKQEYQTKKETFDKGQELIQQYKQAMAERAAADKRAAEAADALAKLFGDIGPHN